MQFSFFCVCPSYFCWCDSHLCAGVNRSRFPRAHKVNAFSIGVDDIFVVPNVDNGFLLQLGAERVVFVLQ